MDQDLELELEALKGILSDPSAEPIKLSYGLLKLITYNFSNEIGHGGFGVVYRGDFPNGVVAVKRSNGPNVTDKQFMDEIKCLQSTKHKNIVRFLGYCADTQEEVKPLDGKLAMGVELNRLFCFEYVPNGNIRQYLEQEKNPGDDWPMRYKMIRGICKGLQYIHEKQIIHLDLKPENVMLDAHMEPKITDFGLSRFLEQGQSRIITQHICGTLRYIAPEVRVNNQLSFKSDMYSLGFIIIELLTGTSMISLVDWDELLGSLHCPRAKMCAEIAQNCVDAERDYRPTIDEVIHRMDELESMMQGFSSHEDFSSTTVDMYPSLSSSQPTYMHASLDALGYYMMQATAFPGTELLDVYPLELRFLSEPGEKYMSCRLTLTNRTDNFVYCIVTQTDFKYSLPPMTSSLVTVLVEAGKGNPLHSRKTKKGKKIPLHSQNTKKGKNIPLGMVGCEMVMFTTTSRDKEEHSHHISKFSVEENTPPEDKFKALQEFLGGELHRAALTASLIVEHHDPLEVHTVGNEGKYFQIDFMDVHPTEPWVLVTASYRVYIWNWQTNEKLGEYTSPVWLGKEVKDPYERYNEDDSVVKFIAREQWAVIGKDDGSITVHTCPTMDQVKEFKAYPDAVRSLAVHQLVRSYCHLVIHPLSSFGTGAVIGLVPQHLPSQHLCGKSSLTPMIPPLSLLVACKVLIRLKKAYEILARDPIHIAFTGARRLVIGYRKGISILDICLE